MIPYFNTPTFTFGYHIDKSNKRNPVYLKAEFLFYADYSVDDWKPSKHCFSIVPEVLANFF